MPSLRMDSPPLVPDRETIEHLLGERNQDNSATRRIKTFGELTLPERLRTGLVTYGTTADKIEGDPYGVYSYWQGNVGHPKDSRMLEILLPIFRQLLDSFVRERQEIMQTSNMLSAVHTADIKEVAKQFALNGSYQIVRDDELEVDIRFQHGSQSVRLLQVNDLDKDVKGSYGRSSRAKSSEDGVRKILGEEVMPVSVQQFLMAEIMRDSGGKMPGSDRGRLAYLRDLRATVQENYRLHLSKEGRLEVAKSASDPDESLADVLYSIITHWPTFWNGNRRDPDFFRQYLQDTRAAVDVWDLVEEDICIVLDCNNQVVFANFENLAGFLHGQEVVDLLTNSLDLWSFFTPLPAPESKRHEVDRYIRRLHPELDLSKANIAELQNAKVAVAHYGCWAATGDPRGRNIKRTSDSKFNRSRIMDFSEDMFPDFAKSTLGTAASLIRYLVESLDPNHLEECRQVFANLPPSRRVSTGTDNFLSLFAVGINGYTQRHVDSNDVQHGLAGLVTVGKYTGGNLCLPQLGLKTKYSSGTCALLRTGRDGLEHLVADFQGPRFFIIGTNHESCRQHARRKMGLDPPLDRKHEEESTLEVDGEDLTTTCINEGDDEHDNDRPLSNKELHGPGALDFFSSSSNSTRTP